MSAYTTYEAAKNALDAAIGDTVADNPEISGDDVAWDMTVAIALISDRDTAAELCRRELGFIPSQVQMTHGPYREDEL